MTLAQAVRRGLHSVVAMYEDRHQLWGLGPGGSVVTRSIRCRRVQVGSSTSGMIAISSSSNASEAFHDAVACSYFALFVIQPVCDAGCFCFVVHGSLVLLMVLPLGYATLSLNNVSLKNDSNPASCLLS